MPTDTPPPPRSPAPLLPELLGELRTSPAFTEVQRAFPELFRLPVALRAPGTFEAPPLGGRRANRFCSLLAGRNGSCSACLRFQDHVRTQASGAPFTAACPMGLVESAVPVRSGGRVVAHLWTGQVRLTAPSEHETADAAARAGEAGVNAAAAAAAHRSSPVVPARSYEAALGLLRGVASHLSTLAARWEARTAAEARERPEIARARAFALEHLTEDIRLDHAAQAAGLSRFHFCKLFRRVTGTGFPDYVTGLRVQAARRLLANPATRVCEAAYAVGFRSLSQCKRSFVRLTGKPPSRCRPAAGVPAR